MSTSPDAGRRGAGVAVLEATADGATLPNDGGHEPSRRPSSRTAAFAVACTWVGGAREGVMTESSYGRHGTDTTDVGEVAVAIDVGPVAIQGDLAVPARAVGVVLFAHGSGSSRRSPRNRWVAGVLQHSGLATLLFDLLTDAEAYDRRNVFDVPLLAQRLTAATIWLRSRPERDLPPGYFGASTGAAAALWAAAEPDSEVRAIVSRGGRPDLALERLPEVRAPTLLIVGSRDPEVLELNRLAQARLRCENRLEIVPGATHLFEEPGTLDVVARLARDWFLAHLPAPGVSRLERG